MKQTQLQWFLSQMLLNNHNRHLLVFISCWIIVSFNYYIIVFHFQDMAGSIYVNGFVAALGELVGNLVIGGLIGKFGVEATLNSSFSFLIIATLLYMLPISSSVFYNAIVLFLIKFFLTCAFAAVFYGTNALFREDLVAVIFAISNLFSRFFTIFVPFVAAAEGKNTAMIWFLSLSVLGLLASSNINTG